MNISSKLIKERKDVYSFEIIDTSPAFINSLRRTLISDIPVFAASKTKFKINESSIKDEMLAKSIKLIRFNQAYNYKDAYYSINVKATEDFKIVTSNDLNVSWPSKKNQNDLFLNGIYLCTLEKDKRLELTGTFEQKTEAEDGAFSCVARAWFIEQNTNENKQITYKFTVHLLETHTFIQLMNIAYLTLKNKFNAFKEKYIGANYPSIFETNEFNGTILGLLVDAIHSQERGIKFVAFTKDHTLINKYTLFVDVNDKDIIDNAFKIIEEKFEIFNKQLQIWKDQ